MSKKKSLSQRQKPLSSYVELLSRAGVAAGLFLIAVVCYFEFFAPEAFTPIAPVADSHVNATEPASDEYAHLPHPSDFGPVKPDDLEEEPGVHRGVIASGDTAGELLQEWLPSGEVHSLIAACNKVYSLAKLRLGQPYVVYGEGENFSRFEYEIDNDSRLVITRENGQFTAVIEEIHYDVQLIHAQGSISSSLFQTMSDIGESPMLAVRLADIFAWEINFIRDVQPEDSFRILLEKRYRDGEFKGYGKLLAAEFVNKGKKFEAYRYTDSFGNPAYFNANGDSLKRAFLKAPLSFTRISSRFNLRRVHPIFNTVRAHPAVDYAAPSGTPVKAIGSGEVTFRGWGKGAGNYISLRHGNAYESMYLHLSGFAKNLKKGKRVHQGEIIGYVGSTGYSTGPHLDFRMKKNGQFVNPEKVLSPRDESVPAKQLAAFKTERDLWRRYLEGEKNLSDYTPEKDTPLP